MHVDNGEHPPLESLFPRRILQLMELARELELSARTAQPVADTARLWVQLRLPYRDSGQLPRWSRRNNAITVTITPGMISASHGSRRLGYPYGLIPRHLLTWRSTEVVRIERRRLLLGAVRHRFWRTWG